MNEQLAGILTEYGARLLGIVLATLLISLYRMAKSYLEAKIGSEKMGQLLQTTEIIVRSLEQEGLIKKLTGAEKKQMAKVLIEDAAAKLGLTLDSAFISDVIEHFVQVINTEAGAFQKIQFIEAKTLEAGE